MSDDYLKDVERFLRESSRIWTLTVRVEGIRSAYSLRAGGRYCIAVPGLYLLSTPC
jgi:hypothetical protein